MLHGGVPRTHPYYRQRHHPHEGADGRQLRSDRVAAPQVPRRPQRARVILERERLARVSARVGWPRWDVASTRRTPKAVSRRPIAMGVTTLPVEVANPARPGVTAHLE